MAPAVTTAVRKSIGMPVWGSVLLGVAALSSGAIWLQFAPRYFLATGARGIHTAHLPLLLVHILAATAALFAGPFLIWSGLRRRVLDWHRKLGLVYLGGGAIGVGAGTLLSLVTSHRSQAFNLSLTILGLVWFTAAALAWRAVRNRRIDVHQEWALRSYILTWSFVACRVPDEALIRSLGAGGDTFILWTGWVLPLFVTELILQFRRTSAVR